MKVLLLISRFDQTGMTTNTLDLYNGLRKFNPETYLLVGIGAMDTAPAIQSIYSSCRNDENIIYFPAPKGHSKLDYIKSIYAICREVNKIKPDIIHCESPYYTFIPWLLRKPFLTTMHVTDIYPTASYKIGGGVIAISDATRKWAEKICHHKPEDIYTVLHGVSASFADGADDWNHRIAVRREFNLPTDKVLVGLIGSVEKRKGHDLLIEAIKGMGKEAREKVHIVFVGSDKQHDHSSQKWLDELIVSNNLQKAVTHIEYTTKVKDIYQCLDISTLPSRKEGFALVVIEAMLADCCVIRSDTEGAYEQIENGVSGYVFENENVEQFRCYLQEMILNDEKRISIAKNGQTRALELFTSDVMAKNTFEVYKKILEKI